MNNPPPLNKKLYLANLLTDDDKVILPRFGLLSEQTKVEKSSESKKNLLRCKTALKHMVESPTKETLASNNSTIIATKDE